MTAEITEENIASNEHILELLDILLNIYLEYDRDILGINIDGNVITHLNLRRNITARQNLNSLPAERQRTISSSRKLFALGAHKLGAKYRDRTDNNNNNNNNNNN